MGRPARRADTASTRSSRRSSPRSQPRRLPSTDTRTGGHVALVLAAHHREVVHAAIVGDAPLSTAAVCALIAASQERLQFWRSLAGSGSAPSAVAEALREMPIERPDGTSAAARDVLGAEDPWFLPGMRVARVAGVGHGLHTERPAPVADLIRDFLRVSAP